MSYGRGARSSRCRSAPSAVSPSVSSPSVLAAGVRDGPGRVFPPSLPFRRAPVPGNRNVTSTQ